MACATIAPQPKRRIECVDGVELVGGPSKCKRVPGSDFNLSPSSFGSPPRVGRLSPPHNYTGRGSPKSLPNKPGSPPPNLVLSFPQSSTKATDSCISALQSEFTSIRIKQSNSPDRELRFNAQQVIDICRQEVIQLDSRLRQEYEADLQNKLAEQYQSFVQYAQDHLQTNMQGPPSEMDTSYIG